MAQRRDRNVNAPMSEAAKSEDLTITGQWTFFTERSDNPLTIKSTNYEWRISSDDGGMFDAGLVIEAANGWNNEYGMYLNGGGLVSIVVPTDANTKAGATPAAGDAFSTDFAFIDTDYDYLAQIGFYGDDLFQFGNLVLDAPFGFYVTEAVGPSYKYPLLVDTANQLTYLSPYPVRFGADGGTWAGSGTINYSTKYVEIQHNNTNGLIDCNSGTLVLGNNNGTVQVGGTSSTVSISPATINMSPSGNMNINPTGQMQLLSGNGFRVFDPGNTAYTDLNTRDTTAGTGHRMTISGNFGGVVSMQAVSLSDDATGTFDIGAGYAMCWLINTYNGTTYAHFGIAGANVPIDYGSGSNVVYGATNPDTDGRVNIWPSSGGGEVSIKNRMGSTRSFYLLAFSSAT